MKSFAELVSEHPRTQPNKPALIEPERSVEYWAAYDRLSDRIAARLIKSGLRRGRPGCRRSADGILLHATFIGAEKAGVVAMGIGPRAGLREVRHLLEVSGAAGIISTRQPSRRRYGGVKASHPAMRQHLLLDADYETGAASPRA